MHVMDYFLVIGVIYKNICLNNYSEKLFCQRDCFTCQSNQDSYFVKHIKFENRKAFKNDLWSINANN